MTELAKPSMKVMETREQVDLEQAAAPKGFNPREAWENMRKTSPTHEALRDAVKALDPLLAPSFMGKTATEADALRDVACAAIDRALASNKERAVLRPAEAASLGRGNEELRKTAVSDLKSAELVVRLERMNNIMTDKLQ